MHHKFSDFTSSDPPHLLLTAAAAVAGDSQADAADSLLGALTARTKAACTILAVSTPFQGEGCGGGRDCLRRLGQNQELNIEFEKMQG